MPRLDVLEDRTLPSTFPVLNLGDSGAGSLRQAILNANSTPGDDAITFSVTGTINLSSALPNLSTNIDLQGPGAASLTVQRSTAAGTNDFGIFSVSSGATVGLSGLTIARGSGYPEGGGIYNAGALTVSNCTVADNLAYYEEDEGGDIGGEGGGVVNYYGTMTISNSTISGNTAGVTGGGIHNSGTLTVSNSTISGNTTVASSGGGIYSSGTLTVSNSTISGNTDVGILNWVGTATVSNSTVSGNVGGGIRNQGTLTVSNSTISGNSSPWARSAGGITNAASSSSSSTVQLVNSTIAENTATSIDRTGSQIYSGPFGTGTFTATVQFRNTIFSGSGGRPNFFADVGGTFVTEGHNLSSDSTGNLNPALGDLPSTNPQLGPLQDNGGPTFTHALLAGSPALDTGDNAGAPEFDQRGLTRIVAGTIDIGAFEVQTPPVTIDGVLINGGLAQRSSIYALNVTFSSTVTLEDGAFEVAREDGSLLGLLVSTEVVDGRTLATITFTGEGLDGYSPADGNYTLTIRADRIRDSLGRRLDGNGDGAPGGDHVEEFFRLYGDSDGDGDVDGFDLEAFQSTRGLTSKDEGFLWWFDFDGDGDVDEEVDYAEFQRRLVLQP